MKTQVLKNALFQGLHEHCSIFGAQDSHIAAKLTASKTSKVGDEKVFREPVVERRALFKEELRHILRENPTLSFKETSYRFSGCLDYQSSWLHDKSNMTISM